MLRKHTWLFVDKSQLGNVKKKAMHFGTWFKTLRKIDGALIDLMIKVAKSTIPELTESIFALVEELEGVMQKDLSLATRDSGFPLAQKFSFIAQRWSTPPAKSWLSDSALQFSWPQWT
jgi:hypothetical protein